MITYQTVGTTEGQFAHYIIRPVLDGFGEIHRAMWSSCPLGDDCHKLIGALLNNWLVARDTTCSKRGSPMFAANSVDVSRLNEKQTITIDFPRNISLAL